MGRRFDVAFYVVGGLWVATGFMFLGPRWSSKPNPLVELHGTAQDAFYVGFGVLTVLLVVMAITEGIAKRRSR
jgi:hypothetical protein